MQKGVNVGVVWMNEFKVFSQLSREPLKSEKTRQKTVSAMKEREQTKIIIFQ